MAEEKIKALSFKVDEVGKYMKGSKKRFEWVVGLNNRTHTIILDFSFISGKVKAYVDGRVLLQNQIPLNTSFQHPFTLDGFALNLIQQGQNCELRINNKVFSHLYTQERTMQQFKKDDSEFGIQMNKDFMSKISGSGQNKITLDIGGQKKGNFKKHKGEEEGDWGGFGDIGVPEGFQLPPGMADSKPNANINSFGTEFDAPTKQQQQQPIDFFGDDQPVQHTSTTVPPQTSLIDNDLLGQQTQAQQKQPNPQPSISSLYQQTNMMNTNQLLFNTNLHQQQAAQQAASLNLNPQISGPGIGLTMGQPLPFNTMGQPSTMFTTGINTQSYATGIPSMAGNSNMQPFNGTPTVPNTQASNSLMGGNLGGIDMMHQNNPSYQINTGFQTGALNLNQLYQTNQAQIGMGMGQPVSPVETKTQPLQQHAGLMFPTGVANLTAQPTVGFNTTVNTNQGKDLFDLM